MSRASPAVSVCMPTYCGARTITSAIDSVLAQSFTDFELIVIDDASPDDTVGVVAACDDPRVKLLRNTRNLGPQGNWNRCLDEARAPLVKLLPHDDLLHPHCLQQQVQALSSPDAADVALTFCPRDVIGPDGRVLLRHRGWPGGRPGRADRATLLSACLRQGTNVIGEPGAVLFRRSAAQAVGGFDMRHPYVIDLDYWFRLLAQGPAWYIPVPLASFRVWQGSWSVSIGMHQAADFHGLMNDLQAADGATTADRWLGRWRPEFNALARQVFYRLFV